MLVSSTEADGQLRSKIKIKTYVIDYLVRDPPVILEDIVILRTARCDYFLGDWL